MALYKTCYLDKHQMFNSDKFVLSQPSPTPVSLTSKNPAKMHCFPDIIVSDVELPFGSYNFNKLLCIYQQPLSWVTSKTDLS